jgi:hypothetical protein
LVVGADDPPPKKKLPDDTKGSGSHIEDVTDQYEGKSIIFVGE